MQSLFRICTELQHSLTALGDELQRQQLLCATAESCTGGLVGAAITSVAGASLWYAGGVVAYANHVKSAVLGVSDDILVTHGAVSEQCVRAMAKGVCHALGAHASISVSGVAGPSGGTEQKPVGTVWLGFYVHGHTSAVKQHFTGSRDDIRAQATLSAIQTLLNLLRNSP